MEINEVIIMNKEELIQYIKQEIKDTEKQMKDTRELMPLYRYLEGYRDACEELLNKINKEVV